MLIFSILTYLYHQFFGLFTIWDMKFFFQPGWYLTVHIKNVSQLVWSVFKKTGSPLVLIGLFAHEHKMSMMNVVLKRTQNYATPIKSKERLIFQCGFRRFATNPIFSQHTNGQKHKVSENVLCMCYK